MNARSESAWRRKAFALLAVTSAPAGRAGPVATADADDVPDSGTVSDGGAPDVGPLSQSTRYRPPPAFDPVEPAPAVPGPADVPSGRVSGSRKKLPGG